MDTEPKDQGAKGTRSLRIKEPKDQEANGSGNQRIKEPKDQGAKLKLMKMLFSA